MRFKATIVVTSEDAPDAKPIVVEGADVEMEYTYPQDIDGNFVLEAGAVPLALTVEWKAAE